MADGYFSQITGSSGEITTPDAAKFHLSNVVSYRARVRIATVPVAAEKAVFAIYSVDNADKVTALLVDNDDAEARLKIWAQDTNGNRNNRQSDADMDITADTWHDIRVDVTPAASGGWTAQFWYRADVGSYWLTSADDGASDANWTEVGSSGVFGNGSFDSAAWNTGGTAPPAIASWPGVGSRFEDDIGGVLVYNDFGGGSEALIVDVDFRTTSQADWATLVSVGSLNDGASNPWTGTGTKGTNWDYTATTDQTVTLPAPFTAAPTFYNASVALAAAPGGGVEERQMMMGM